MYKSHRSMVWGLALIGLMVFAISACDSVPKPKTFNESAAVAIVTVTQVRETATALLVAKKITVEDARNVQKQADNARSGIEVARALYKADPFAGQMELSTVVKGLTILQQYLTTRGGT